MTKRDGEWPVDNSVDGRDVREMYGGSLAGVSQKKEAMGGNGMIGV